jgi:MOSC domain-containing protein YiiM
MPERDVHVAIADIRSGPVVENADAARDTTPIAGHVVQVSTSPGGVPKRAVESAFVGRLGLAGDDHHDAADHGGPTRAVCLLAIEVIRRVAAEGHGLAPGTAGENITTGGIELGGLPIGTRLGIGPDVVVELTSPTYPCKTIAHNFADGRFSRLSSRVHPLDTRVYASVEREGRIGPGDEIRVLSLGDADPGG